MRTKKRRVRWLVGITGTLLVLLLAVILLVPRFVNLERVRERILTTISQRVGGHVEYQKLDLSLFPRPRVAIHQASLSIPGKTSGSLRSMEAYPKILPLFRGKLRLAKVRVEDPDFTIKLPERSAEKKKGQRPAPIVNIGDTVAGLFATLSSDAPDLVVVVKKGRVNLSQENQLGLSFEDIDARFVLPPSGFRIDVSCSSSLWERVSVKGALDDRDLKGTAEIDLAHFRPHTLMSILLPKMNQRLLDSQVNVHLSLVTDGLTNLQAKVDGSIFFLAFQQGDEKLVVKGKGMEATVDMSENRAMVLLTTLDLDNPQLSISGKFQMDQVSPPIRVEMEGRDVDVASTREVALALAGKVPVIQEICDFFRGGRVPLVTLSSQGRSMADLDNMENIVVTGSIAEGKIVVPAAKVDLGGRTVVLEDVRGEGTVAQGILEGKNLEARLGNSRAREGRLRLGLEGPDAPLQLDTVVEADLRELPPLMKGVLRDERFEKELDLVKELRGTAVGRLAVGDSMQAIKATIDVSELNLFARYGRIPYPLEVRKGQFFYDGDTIAVRDLSGKMGNSFFSGLSVQVGFEKAPHLEVTSDKSFIVVDETYPWLSSFKGVDVALKDIKSVRGNIALSTLDLKGPLFAPDRWNFQATGEVEEFALESTFLPGPVAVQSVKFKAVPQRLSLTDAKASLLDALLQVSCVIENYREGLNKIDASLQGTVGAESIQWVSQLVDLPPNLRVRPPLSLSQVRMGWNREGETSLSGDVTVKDGPTVSVDVRLDPERLVIRDMVIEDGESRASLALDVREKELDVTFSGNLSERTLERMVSGSTFGSGWMKGDFRTRLGFDRPMTSTAEGDLEVRDLTLVWLTDPPAEVDHIVLQGRGNAVSVRSGVFTWLDHRVSLEGDVRLGDPGFVLDMDFSTKAIELDKLEKDLRKSADSKESNRSSEFWDLPLAGTVRVRAESLKYERFTWNPFHADVNFGGDGAAVVIKEARACGISTPGVVQVTPQDVALDFRFEAEGTELNPTITCLSGREVRMTGSFDLGGNIRARGKPEEVINSAQGKVDFLAKDGRIYRLKSLAKILGVLSVTEVFRGKLPDLGKEGLAYNSITLKGNLQNGTFVMDEAILDGVSVEMVSEGTIDLIDEKVDVKVLVAPLKTVSAIARKIPVVRHVAEGPILAIPVKVEGDLGNPTVTPISAKAAGGGLLGVMKRTLEVPVKVIESTLPGTQKAGESTEGKDTMSEAD